MKLYLAGPWERRDVIARMALYLARNGHKVTSRWLTEHMEAETPEMLVEQAHNDLDDVRAADVLVLDTRVPGSPRGGRHTEFGYALALGRRVILLGPRVNVFHYLEEVAQVDTPSALLRALKETSCN